MLIKNILLILLFIFSERAFACLCNPETIESSYRNSSIAVLATMIGEDSVVMAQSIYTNKKGIRFGRQRYKLDSGVYRRIGFVVEKNYKSSAQVPDTIYVLINKRSDCIYHFQGYYGEFGRNWNTYVLFASKVSEYIMETTTKKKRKIRRIKEHIIKNAFYVNQCSSTQRSNQKALAELEKLKT